MRSPLLVGSSLLGLLTVLGCARSSPQAGFPVQWSARLELPSLAEIDARLAQAFPDSVDVVRYASREDLLLDRNGEHAHVRDCVTYMDLTDQGYAPRSDMAVRELQRQGAICRALRALKAATPSRVTYLGVPWHRQQGLLPPGGA